jgi:hypothetical protein
MTTKEQMSSKRFRTDHAAGVSHPIRDDATPPGPRTDAFEAERQAERAHAEMLAKQWRQLGERHDWQTLHQWGT